MKHTTCYRCGAELPRPRRRRTLCIDCLAAAMNAEALRG